MKLKFFSVLLVMVMTLMFSACGGGNSSSVEGEDEGSCLDDVDCDVTDPIEIEPTEPDVEEPLSY